MVSFAEAVAQLTAYQDRLDQAMRRNRGLYEQAFASAPHGIGAHEIDLDKVLRRVNPGELAILGYSEAQMVGRLVSEFIVMQEASERAIEQKLRGTRELKPFCRTFRRADGSAVFLVLVDRHIRDERGRVVGIRTALMEAEQA